MVVDSEKNHNKLMDTVLEVINKLRKNIKKNKKNEMKVMQLFYYNINS